MSTLLGFSSCQKSDEKMEELILGTWVVESKTEPGFNGSSLVFPHCLPSRITFFKGNTYFIEDGNLYNSMTVSQSYNINDGKISFDSLYCKSTGDLVFDLFEVVRINKEKLVLKEGERKWKYKKI